MNLQKRITSDKMNTIFKSLTFDHIPIHSSTRSPIHSFMQNEPNLQNDQRNLSEVVLISRPWRIPQNNQSCHPREGGDPNQLKAPIHHQESNIENMQNEPNLKENGHKCLHNIDLQKYPHPALPVSTNNQLSRIEHREYAKRTQFANKQP